MITDTRTDTDTDTKVPGSSALDAEAPPASQTPPSADQAEAAIKKQVREVSTIGFAYEDLSAALRLAHLVHNTYGGECTADQLAASSGAKPSSGAFRLKVSAGRLYGVLGGSGSRITATTLGVNAVDNANTGARADAFLNVPLHRRLYDEFIGGTLPDDSGLEIRIRQLGVSTKQVTTARQVFARSAEQAGFFAHGRSRLVMPPRGRVAPGTTEGEPPAHDNQTDQNPESSIMRHPLIQGLLAVLPEPGTDFPADDRQMWLTTLQNSLEFIYGRTPRQETQAADGQGSPRPAT
ncbi:MAG: hypothetical protein ACR2KK_10120 [Acidimicrobiales bacterium]